MIVRSKMSDPLTLDPSLIREVSSSEDLQVSSRDSPSLPRSI